MLAIFIIIIPTTKFAFPIYTSLIFEKLQMRLL